MATPKAPKLFIIETNKSGRSSDRTYTTAPSTLEELKRYFGYTLEIGRSWNKKIKHPDNIKTIAQFVKALEQSYDEKEANCYDRTSVKLVLA
jgi:hypothetical protein